MDVFAKAEIQHTKGTSPTKAAASQVLSEQDFENAWTEITAWDGYAATPLVDLGALASTLTISKILYKHEGPRFGLGSFKALGAAYAALRVLQREVSRRIGQGGG